MKNLPMKKLVKVLSQRIIITIVVLLILAIVAIGTVRNSDIIGYAQNAADSYETEKGKENEAIKGAEDLLNQYANGGKVDVEAQFAKFKENPEAFKHPDQRADNEDRAIGTDGTAVNMDWWKYAQDDINKEIALTGRDGSFEVASYTGRIDNGSIVGSVPQYIKPAGSDEIYTVTSMKHTFYNCTSLTTAPTIPSSVTNMEYTFSYCTSLITAPTIPSSVTDMSYTFSMCSDLTKAPTIPSSVTNMEYTFSYCTSLITAPTILSGVTNMKGTFFRCTSLATAPTIPSGVTNMDYTFSSCTSLTGTLRIEATNIKDASELTWWTNIRKIQLPAGSVTENTIRTLEFYDIDGHKTNVAIEPF